jgi:hypothetical protein
VRRRLTLGWGTCRGIRLLRTSHCSRCQAIDCNRMPRNVPSSAGFLRWQPVCICRSSDP